MHLQENTLLQGGKYRIKRFINRGGFGCTYEAENVMLRVRVAIKELFVSDICQRNSSTGLITLFSDAKQPFFDKLRRKFVDEARALASLHHPGIVRVTDIFEENGTSYYVMDYIDGYSLRDLVKNKGALHETEALQYIRQVADTLLYVHNNKRLHLDIKPANIMVDDDNKVILIDFGVSKQYDEESGENTSTLMGYTRGYAPIEQIDGDVQAFAPATDIYAMGATLYNLLSGEVPPVANKLIKGLPIETLQAHNISNTTIQAIRCCMQADKNDRPQTVAKFLTLLNSAADDGEDPDITVITELELPVVTDNPPTTPDTSRKKDFSSIFAWAMWLVIIVSALAVLGYWGIESIQNHQAKLAREQFVADSIAHEKYLQDSLARVKFVADSIADRERFLEDSLATVKKAEEAEKQRLDSIARYEATHINGHEFVDLGLSVKWATCNVGADTPEDFGEYYAWGEILPKTKYTEKNYKWYDTSKVIERGYYQDYYIKKYNHDSQDGKADNKSTLDKADDAAAVNWGKGWRMPTYKEWQELRKECDWTWTQINGSFGYKVSSKTNGNSIFLPAAGEGGYEDTQIGHYWSSTLNYDGHVAKSVDFDSRYKSLNYYPGHRFIGNSIRPVTD